MLFIVPILVPSGNKNKESLIPYRHGNESAVRIRYAPLFRLTQIFSPKKILLVLYNF